MIGEFGGIGAFVEGKEWKPKSCHTYLHVNTAAEEAATYVKMAATIASRVDHVSASVYTQTTVLPQPGQSPCRDEPICTSHAPERLHRTWSSSATDF